MSRHFAISSQTAVFQSADGVYVTEMAAADPGGKAEQAAIKKRADAWTTAVSESKKLLAGAEADAERHTREALQQRAALESSPGTPASYLIGKLSTASGARIAVDALVEADNAREAWWFLAGLRENAAVSADVAGEIRTKAMRVGTGAADSYLAQAIAARHAYAQLLTYGALCGMVNPTESLTASNNVGRGRAPDGTATILPAKEVDRLLHDVAGVERPVAAAA